MDDEFLRALPPRNTFNCNNNYALVLVEASARRSPLEPEAFETSLYHRRSDICGGPDLRVVDRHQPDFGPLLYGNTRHGALYDGNDDHGDCGPSPAGHG